MPNYQTQVGDFSEESGPRIPYGMLTNRIMNILAASQPQTTRQIAAQIDLPYNNVNVTLHRLLDQQKISKTFVVRKLYSQGGQVRESRRVNSWRLRSINV